LALDLDTSPAFERGQQSRVKQSVDFLIIGSRMLPSCSKPSTIWGTLLDYYTAVRGELED
jgi:hypothetical protein